MGTQRQASPERAETTEARSAGTEPRSRHEGRFATSASDEVEGHLRAAMSGFTRRV